MLVTDPDRIEDELEAPAKSRGDDLDLEVTDGEDAGGDVTCTHCGRSLPDERATVCPHCGYYAALGICIDLDTNWERLASGQPPIEDDAEGKPKSHLQVWIELIPIWGWVLIGCNVAVLVASAFARVAIPSGLTRTVWSVGQLLGGIAAFCTCHFLAYLIAIADDASFNILDILLKPIKVWKDVVRGLPQTLRLAAGGTCGLTAVFGSLVIIGALPYGMLLDWGIKERPQQNLAQAIVAQAQKMDGGEEGLEDAINDFAGAAGDLPDDNALSKPNNEKNVRVDCVIVGYTLDPKDPTVVASLLIAREFKGRLKFVGRLTDGLDEDVRLQYAEKFQDISRQQPFVSVPPEVIGRWVEPKYTCRVKCRRETSSGYLMEMELESLLGVIDLGR